MVKFLKNIVKKNEYISRVIIKLRWELEAVLIRYCYVYNLKRNFKMHLRYRLNLNNPKTFNEKIQWLKAYYRDPIMTKCADKYGVRDIVGQTIGEKYLIELYGVYSNVDEIDFDKLPCEFVLKPSHSSGRVIICRDKNKLDIEGTKKKLRKWLKENYYYHNGEWVYKDIKPQIICEKLLNDNIKDYKLHFINGEMKLLLIVANRQYGNKTETYYDDRLNKIDIKWGGIDIGKEAIPESYKKMLELSSQFAKRFPMVRVDWYEIDGKIYFGELTFFPANGLEPFEPIEWDYKLGSMLDLDKCKKEYLINQRGY